MATIVKKPKNGADALSLAAREALSRLLASLKPVAVPLSLRR